MSGEMLDFIRETIGDALPASGMTRDATLTKTTEGAYTAGQASGDTAKTTTDYPCQGIVSGLQSKDIDGTLITRQDRQIKLIGASIAVDPAQGDVITIDNGTYRVIAILDCDAARATWTLACRG